MKPNQLLSLILMLFGAFIPMASCSSSIDEDTNHFEYSIQNDQNKTDNHLNNDGTNSIISSNQSNVIGKTSGISLELVDPEEFDKLLESRTIQNLQISRDLPTLTVKKRI